MFHRQIFWGGDLPEPGSLGDLKQQLESGTAQSNFPVGTEIEDDYNGQSNPLIVVKYLDGSESAYQNTDGSTAKGVILQRKFITDVGQIWNTTNSSNYGTSPINTFLNGTYLNRCSSGVQSIMSECKVPVVISSGDTKVQCKWFLPSMEEVYGDASVAYAPGKGKEGSYFPYWKDKSKLTAPSNGTAVGRAVKINSVSGNNGGWWLRSKYYISDYAWYVSNNGRIEDTPVNTTSLGVLPCCYISADDDDSGPITASEYNALNITAQDYNSKEITAEEYNTNAKAHLK